MVEDAVTTAFKRARGELRPLLRKEGSTGCTIDNRPKARSSTEGPSYRNDAAFFRDGVAESILTDETLRRLVLGTAIHPQAESSVIENDIRKITVAPGLQRILLTILCFGTDGMLRDFETKFLGENNCGYSDKDLPFDHSIASRLFGEDDAANFLQYQFGFVALTLGTGIDAEYGPHHILPYVPNKELGRGGFGKVDQVKVERGHFLYREPQSRNRDPVFLARKQFEPDAESFRSFERERRTLRQLADQKTCPSNIVTAICTLVCTLPQGRNLGSIFFPPAICDLDAYIRNDGNFPNNAARRSHIQQMVEVCDAMHWLSENLSHDSTTGTYVERSYIHYDMKPSNILIYEDVSVGNGAVVFKIADFGQTREINRHPEGRARSKKKHSPFPDGGRIYEGTFRAPEIHGQNVRDKNVEKGDVWSFGCILLLVILFGAQGAQAIQEFEDDRVRKSLSKRDDSFCNPQNGSSPVCNQAVLDCLASLRDHEVSADMYMNPHMMKQCIDYLRDGTLVKDAQRDNISKVCKKLRGIYNQFEPRSAAPSSVNHGELPRGAYRLGHSPDGKIFCCARDKIYLYTPRRPILNPTNNHHPWSRVVKAESSSCSRETLCVVAEWVGWFRCTLFKIGSEDSAPRDVAIRAVTTRAVKVALSPDDRMLAIACEPKEDGEACVKLFYLEDLSPVQTEGSRYSTSSSARRSSPVVNTNPGYLSDTHGTLSLVELYRDLRFSANSQFLYCAWEQTGSNFSVQVAIWEISPDQSHLTTRIQPDIIIKDDDFTFQQSFFSTLLPFTTSAGFFTITHQKYIVIHDAHARHSGTRRIKFSGKGKGDLRSILISSNDQKVVILATKTKEKNKIDVWGGPLGNLFTEGRSLRKLALDENISFDELEDDAYLLEEEANHLQLRLTSLKKGQSYWHDISELFR